MKSNEYALHCSFQKVTPHFYQVNITVPAPFVDAVFYEATVAQQEQSQTRGFLKGKTPLDYITENYISNLVDHVQKYLFTYFVLPFLYENLHIHKFLMGGEPRLKSSHIKLHEDAVFNFDLSIITPMELKNWKHFNFKAPKRKNYKDIDRQVDDFMKEEMAAEEAHKSSSCTTNDWVNFNIKLVSAEHQPLFSNHTASLWVKIGNEAADIALQEIFLGKTVGDEFYCNAPCLQEFFSNGIQTRSLYHIKIKTIVPHISFCFDSFKKHFKIQTKKDMQKKLIEVFSYRNDFTQRRAIIEEVFKLLFSKHTFEPPHYTILRQQQQIIEVLHSNPDYHVYKTEENFYNNIEKLAIKQVKEMLLIDQIAHEENLNAIDSDIKDYLNLTIRPRMKEFIYFIPPETRVNGQEFPISDALLSQTCLREKALNHVLHHLTKK